MLPIPQDSFDILAVIMNRNNWDNILEAMAMIAESNVPVDGIHGTDVDKMYTRAAANFRMLAESDPCKFFSQT